MNEKTYPEGMRLEPPRAGAPDFVKGRAGINVAKFGQWLVKHADSRGWVNLDLLESREGSLYFVLRKPPLKSRPQAETKTKPYPARMDQAPDNMDDEVPF